MKLPLATGVLSPPPPPAPFVATFRVNRVFDRKEQPRFSSDEIPDTSFTVAPANAHWDVTIEGAELVLANGSARMRGRETSNVFGDRRFEIYEGAFAGGRFVIRGEDAELTLFGSGVAVASSERGKLVTR